MNDTKSYNAFSIIIKWLAVTSFCLLSLLLIYNSLPYYTNANETTFLKAKRILVQESIWKIAFYMHIIGATLCLITGILQFSKRIRIRNIHIHKWLGRMYVVSVLFLAWPSGQYLSIFASGGIFIVIPFFISALLWGISTVVGYRYIIKKNNVLHSNWMIRSYCYAATAVAFRTYYSILRFGMDIDMEVSSITAQWLSLLGNILIAEFMIRRKIV